MLLEFLIKDGIFLEPSIQKKWHLLQFLTSSYCNQVDSELCDQIFETVLQREIKVSTGLGGGIAIPHARTDLVDRTGIIFARFKEGIEWESMDGGPVQFLFLVIGPVSSAEEYLFVLSKISKMLSRKENREKLLKAKTTRDVRQVMANVKERQCSRS